MNYLSYWEKNIRIWGECYLDISHGSESLIGPKWFTWIYGKTILKIERKLMKKRFRLTKEFLDTFLKPDMSFLDLGCGTGIFSAYALKKGAQITAIDFAENSVSETQNLLKKIAHESSFNNTFVVKRMDISEASIPHHDVCLIVGVLPYIANVKPIFSDILANQKVSLIQYVNAENVINRFRIIFPMLNTRRLQMVTPSQIDLWAQECGLKVLSRTRMGTGFIDLLSKKND